MADIVREVNALTESTCSSGTTLPVLPKVLQSAGAVTDEPVVAKDIERLTDQTEREHTVEGAMKPESNSETVGTPKLSSKGETVQKFIIVTLDIIVTLYLYLSEN